LEKKSDTTLFTSALLGGGSDFSGFYEREGGSVVSTATDKTNLSAVYSLSG
jgi:galactokinase/mevalonate kinase-like predicted kinase